MLNQGCEEAVGSPTLKTILTQLDNALCAILVSPGLGRR